MTKTAVYTLLIVESPVIARIIQKISPSSVYVMATGGFCWHPSYKGKTNTLKTVADPEKRSFRKELKQQAQWANRIIVATDNDPSGDFIAWSIATFLDPLPVQRSFIKNLTRKSIMQLLSDIRELNPDRLKNRLTNRFLAQKVWADVPHLPDMQLAGISALFGTAQPYSHFLDENNTLFKCSEPVLSSYNEWHTVHKNDSGPKWEIKNPLSTYDVIEYIFFNKMASSFRDAQALLQTLFETVLPVSEHSLISYPRTNANGFYSESWEAVKTQFLRVFSDLEFKPNFLQNSIESDSPHESIHPLDLTIKPEDIKGELHGLIGLLYEWIYNQSVNAIAIPRRLKTTYTLGLNPEIYFYPENSNDTTPSPAKSLHPCFTISDFGKSMNRLGVCKPSGFGKAMDEWVFNQWIHIEKNVVKPGESLKKHLGRAEEFRDKLSAIRELMNGESVKTETIERILSS